MAGRLDLLLQEALQLSVDQRAELVCALLATLEPDTPSEYRTEGRWISEIERRARAAMAGSPWLSWDAAKAESQGRLRNRGV